MLQNKNAQTWCVVPPLMSTRVEKIGIYEAPFKEVLGFDENLSFMNTEMQKNKTHKFIKFPKN